MIVSWAPWLPASARHSALHGPSLHLHFPSSGPSSPPRSLLPGGCTFCPRRLTGGMGAAPVSLSDDRLTRPGYILPPFLLLGWWGWPPPCRTHSPSSWPHPPVSLGAYCISPCSSVSSNTFYGLQLGTLKKVCPISATPTPDLHPLGAPSSPHSPALPHHASEPCHQRQGNLHTSESSGRLQS